MKSKSLFLIFSLVLFTTKAEALQLCGTLAQGEIILGKAEPTEEVYFKNQKLTKTQDGKFFIALSRDESPEQFLITESPSGQKLQHDFTVAPTKWNIQNIKGIPSRKVEPPASDLQAIKLEQNLLREVLSINNANTYWQSGFIKPVEGRISGAFGGQRIMNKIPKSPHRGMDIAAPSGTEVKASASGQVVLAYPNLFYSGNLVVIDHGFGLQTLYAHLSKMTVKRGDMVSQGDIIGHVGKTGRATGPHLHFGASLNDIRFNPQSLLNLSHKKQECLNL